MKFFLLGVLLLISCATPYYNAFFHAEILFEKGEIEWQKKYYSNTNDDKAFRNRDLEEAIKKCKYVLERFGVSGEINEYADDAYLMIAQASYYLEDYDAVITSAEFLKKNIPNSPLLPKVALLEGDTYMKRGDFSRAKESYKSIPLKFQNLEIVAKSKLSTAKILISEGEHDEAVKVLESTLTYGKENALDGNYEENTRYELIKILTDVYLEKNQYVKILNWTQDILSFSDIDLKMELVEIRLNALEQLEQIELFTDYINELSEDSDFDLHPEFIEYLKLKNMLLLNRDINDGFSTYYFLHKKSEYLGKVKLLEVNYLERIGNVDSALVLYKTTLPLLKDQKLKKIHEDRYKRVSKEQILLKNELKFNSDLLVFSNRLDSLKEFITDTVYSEKLEELKKYGKQKSENDYEMALFYFEHKEFDRAEVYFKKYTTIGTDMDKQANSYIHIAYINEKENKVFSDSIYQYVMTTFDSHKNNLLLKKKLGLHVEKETSYNESIYNTFVDQINFKTVTIDELNSQVEVIKSKLDSNSYECEKIDFLRINYLLNNKTNNDLAVSYIIDFKKKYPTSDFIKRIEHFILSKEKLSIMEEEAERLKRRANQPILITKPKPFYDYEKDVVVEVNIQVTPKGDFYSFIVTNDLFKHMINDITPIIINWKFEPFEGKENRSFITDITFKKKVVVETNKDRE